MADVSGGDFGKSGSEATPAYVGPSEGSNSPHLIGGRGEDVFLVFFGTPLEFLKCRNLALNRQTWNDLHILRNIALWEKLIAPDPGYTVGCTKDSLIPYD